MTEEEVVAEFSRFDDEWVPFSAISNPLHSRRDMCGFMIIDNMFPGSDCDIISAAEHDKIWLDIVWDEFCEKVTPEIIHDLVACGVVYEDDGLFMFA